MRDIDLMQHPVYKRVVTMLYQDQGLSAPGDYFFSVDGSSDFEIAANFLATLTDEELETICIGDQEEWDPVFSKTSPVTAEATHRVLDLLFMEIGM